MIGTTMPKNYQTITFFDVIGGNKIKLNFNAELDPPVVLLKIVVLNIFFNW
jgi:hypothetical protein